MTASKGPAKTDQRGSRSRDRRKYRLIVLVRSDDVLELPLCVAESVGEMAELTGMKWWTIYYSLQGQGADVWHDDGWHRVIDCTG